MNLWILFVVLILETLTSLYLFKGDILCPAVGFNCIFTISSLDLILMSEYWNVNLTMKTVLIILTGTISFTIASLIIDRKKNTVISIKYLFYYDKNVKIPSFILKIIIASYLAFIVVSMVYIIRSNGFSLSISRLFLDYSNSITGGERLELPSVLNLFLIVFSSAGYVWCYLLVENWKKYNKINFLYIFLIILTCVIGISTGKRGDLVAILVCLAIMLILGSRESKKIRRSIYIIIFCFALLIAVSFQSIATFMGRDSDLFSPIEYFSIYLGAPILNLSTSTANQIFEHPVPLSETFHSLYTSIGEYFNIDNLIYTTDRIFWSSSNGKRTGNVATAFYDYYHDGSFLGVIAFSIICAFIVQTLYKKIKTKRCHNRMFSVIIYSYMYWLTIRSFFANSFFEWVTIPTIYTLLCWWFMSYIIPTLNKRRK